MTLWRRGLLVLVGLTLLSASPAEAQSRRDKNLLQQAEQDRQESEKLHRDMLELRKYERLGRRADAIAVGERLLKEFPGNRRVEDALIHLYRLDHRDTELLELLKQRIGRDPDDLASVREVCAHLLARRQQDLAMDLLQRAIKANSKDENRYRMGAVLFRSHRMVDVAIQLYRQGREAIGRETIFAAELAQLEESRANYGAAIGEYLLLVMDPDRRSRARRKIVNLLERAEQTELILAQITELKKRHPKSSPVQDIAATAFLQTGRYEEAFDAARAADRHADDQGEHLLEFGRLALDTDEGEIVDLEKARTGVKALKLLPRRHEQSNLIPEASRLLAEGLVNVARQVEPGKDKDELLDDAVTSLNLAIERGRFPKLQRDAQALKGMILFEDLGRHEEALETFELLSDELKSNGESHHVIQVQKGLVLAAMDRFDEARTVLEEVANSAAIDGSPPATTPGRKHNPTPEEIGRARASFYLAELKLIEGEYREAETSFAALAERAPEDRLANDCLGIALVLLESEFDHPAALKLYGDYRKALLRKKPAEARTALEAIVQGHEGSTLQPLAMFALGQQMESEGKYEVALQKYAELVERHAEHRLAPRALEAIGDVHLHKLGSPETAVEAYTSIIVDYAGDLFLDDVRKKLVQARRVAGGEDDATP